MVAAWFVGIMGFVGDRTIINSHGVSSLAWTVSGGGYPPGFSSAGLKGCTCVLYNSLSVHDQVTQPMGTEDCLAAQNLPMKNKARRLCKGITFLQEIVDE